MLVELKIFPRFRFEAFSGKNRSFDVLASKKAFFSRRKEQWQERKIPMV